MAEGIDCDSGRNRFMSPDILLRTTAIHPKSEKICPLSTTFPLRAIVPNGLLGTPFIRLSKQLVEIFFAHRLPRVGSV